MKKNYVALAIMEAYGPEFIEAEASAQAAMASGQEEPESDLLTLHEGVGIIEIKGKLTNRDSYFNSWYGLISYNQIRAAAVEAIELGAGALLFDYDTPGGAVAGMGDHSSFLASLPIETVAHTSGTMASAGYFSAASNDHLFADSMSEVGSIGVVMQHMEMTKMLKDQGIKTDIIRSGSKKAIGGPYEKLSPENRRYLQGQVDTFAAKFFDFVSEARGIPLPAMGHIKEGGTFIGEEAVQAGLVDKIMSFDEALVYTMDLAQKKLDNDRNNSDYYSNNHSFSSSMADGGSIMPKKISTVALAAIIAAGKGTPAIDAEGNDVLTQEQLEALTPEEQEAYALAHPAEGEEGAAAEGEEGAAAEGEDHGSGEAGEDLAADLVVLQGQYDASQVELVEAAEANETLTAEIAAVTALAEGNLAGFKEIVVGQVNLMRTALSLTAVEMEDFTPEAILTEYSAVLKTFESSLPVGGVVPNEEGDDRKEAVSRNDVGDMNALGF